MSDGRRDGIAVDSKGLPIGKHLCQHDYKEVAGDYERERYKCSKCGDSYNLYYDEMR